MFGRLLYDPVLRRSWCVCVALGLMGAVFSLHGGALWGRHWRSVFLETRALVWILLGNAHLYFAVCTSGGGRWRLEFPQFLDGALKIWRAQGAMTEAVAFIGCEHAP